MAFTSVNAQDTIRRNRPNNLGINISNCFQKINIPDGAGHIGPIKLLNDGSKKFYIADVSGVGIASFIHLWAYDETTNYWNEVPLNNQGYDYVTVQQSNNVIIDPNTGLSTNAYAYYIPNFTSLDHVIDLGDKKKFKLTILRQTLTPGQYYNEFEVLDIEMVEPLDELKVTSNNGECFEMNKFNFSLAFPELEGFCGTFGSTYISPVDPLDANGLPATFNFLVISNSADETLSPNTCNDSPLCTQAPASAPDPVTCRCIDMKLDITINPCQSAPLALNCEPMQVQKTIEVCCDCDTRENSGSQNNN